MNRDTLAKPRLFYFLDLPALARKYKHSADYLSYLQQDLLGESLFYRTHQFLLSKINEQNKNIALDNLSDNKASFLFLLDSGSKNGKDEHWQIDELVSQICQILQLKEEQRILVKSKAELAELEELKFPKEEKIYLAEPSSIQEGLNRKNATLSFSKLLRFFLKSKFAQLEKMGVQLLGSKTLLIAPEVQIEPGTVIYPNSCLLGKSVIGRACQIGPNSWVKDSQIKERCKIVFSYLEDCQVAEDCQVGPFSHLREKSVLSAGVRVGNFVETKNTQIGLNSRACHLSYLGDSEIGKDVNIGAGAIIANYDALRERKNFSQIKDKTKIGSNSVLISPVVLEEETFVAAGSVITSSSQSPESLLISRNKQLEIEGWVSRQKNKHSVIINSQNNFVLVGMMLTGKSNLGKFWSEQFAFHFLDFDELIESTNQKKIREIVESSGEEHFRSLEKALLKKLLLEKEQKSESKRYIYSTGGGIVKDQENCANLKLLGKVIWLRSKAETILRRTRFSQEELDKRPLLKSLDSLKSEQDKINELNSLILERNSLYESVADYQIETDNYDLDFFKRKFSEII